MKKDLNWTESPLHTHQIRQDRLLKWSLSLKFVLSLVLKRPEKIVKAPYIFWKQQYGKKNIRVHQFIILSLTIYYLDDLTELSLRFLSVKQI